MSSLMWVAVNASFTKGMHEILYFHETNIILGIVTFTINVLLLFVFLISPVLRKKTEMLMVLCIADGTNCFTIAIMGLNRYLLYSRVINTSSIPIRTAWQCAIEPWLIFRIYGDLWPPTIQAAMAIDRMTAVFYPVQYNNQFSKKRRGTFFVSTFVAVTIAVLIGYIAAFSRRNVSVKYWCGRKAAFGNIYASFIYLMTILGYVFSFILTIISYFKSKYWMKSSSSKRQLIKIRYQIFLSMFSVILISVPYGIGLFSQYITKVVDFIAKPSTYLSCINSSLSIFIYLALYGEFRREFVQMFRMLICHIRKEYRWGTRLSTTNRLVPLPESTKSSLRPEFLKH